MDPVEIDRFAGVAVAGARIVMTAAWSRLTTPAVVARRAAGRTAYNNRRKLQAALQSLELMATWEEMLNDGIGLFDQGGQAEMARRLGVSRATVSRAVAYLKRSWGMAACPTCGHEIGMRRWRALEEEGSVTVTERMTG